MVSQNRRSGPRKVGSGPAAAAAIFSEIFFYKLFPFECRSQAMNAINQHISVSCFSRCVRAKCRHVTCKLPLYFSCPREPENVLRPFRKASTSPPARCNRHRPGLTFRQPHMADEPRLFLKKITATPPPEKVVRFSDGIVRPGDILDTFKDNSTHSV